MARRIASLAALVLLSVTAPAAAADFTINVPVTIDNMPAARQLQVLCSAYDTTDGTGDARNVIGSFSSPRLPVSGGRYSGTVTVTFNADAGRLPSLARSYACYVNIFGAMADGREFEAAYMGLPSLWQTATGQRVTVEPSTMVVRGTIP
jgi:hypothetical protein